MKILIDANPEALLVQDIFGRTPLYRAVEYEAGESIAFLEIIFGARYGAKAATIPCYGENKFKGLNIGDIHSRPTTRFYVNRNITSTPESHRTPVFMVWETALHYVSSEDWSRRRRNCDMSIPSGKRMQKAFGLLECAYLNVVQGHISKPLNHRRKNRLLSKRRTCSNIQ